jgi:epoxyqueuosine reductase
LSATLPPGDWVARLREWAAELGFAGLGVSEVDLSDAEPGLARWLAEGFHGEMDYMARHGSLRARPAELVPGTVRAVMVAMDYAPGDPDWIAQAWTTLGAPERAYVSRYALGRDYHKVVRHRLAALARRLQAAIGPFGWRAFCDSAPVMEVELARRAGLGWRGKHTLVLSRAGGSMRFIGTLYTDLPLPSDAPVSDHCGRCTACLDACPTQAIVAPYRLDARRCISYLTIELSGDIPVEFRRALGNRRRPACPISRSDISSIASRCASCSPGIASDSSRPSRGRPSGASAMNAGCATSRWPWAMRRAHRR